MFKTMTLLLLIPIFLLLSPVSIGAESVWFDGDDDIITAANENNWDIAYNKKWSTVFTIKPAGVAFYTVYAKYDAGTGLLIATSVQSDQLVLWILMGGTGLVQIYGLAGIPSCVWTDIAITYDGSSSANGISFYINGEITPKNILTDTLSGGGGNAVTPDFGLDAAIAGNPFNLDDFYFFNGVELSTAQINNLTSKRFRGSNNANSLIANFSFDQGMNLKDWSGNENHIISISGALLNQPGSPGKK